MKLCTQQEILRNLCGRIYENTPRHATVNLEHRDLSIYISVEDRLHNIKKQTEDNIVGWVVGQPLTILQFAIQFFKELKTTALVLPS